MAKKQTRFIKVQSESIGLMTETMILVDRETGVNYLCLSYGQGSGITPLLDREGRPIVTPVRPEYDE